MRWSARFALLVAATAAVVWLLRLSGSGPQRGSESSRHGGRRGPQQASESNGGRQSPQQASKSDGGRHGPQQSSGSDTGSPRGPGGLAHQEDCEGHVFVGYDIVGADMGSSPARSARSCCDMCLSAKSRKGKTCAGWTMAPNGVVRGSR